MQRHLKRKGDSEMTPERIKTLESVPGWYWNAEDPWPANFKILEDFITKNRCFPSWNELYRGVKIGAWVNSQRSARKGQTRGKLTPERIAALESELQGVQAASEASVELCKTLEQEKERARSEFGMVKKDETLYLIVE